MRAELESSVQDILSVRPHADEIVRLGADDAALRGDRCYFNRRNEQPQENSASLCHDRRANSVKEWLVQKEGLKNVRFVTAGFGAKKPVVPNTKPDGSDDPAGRQKNRRVEIVVMK
jgi:OmpA family protein